MQQARANTICRVTADSQSIRYVMQGAPQVHVAEDYAAITPTPNDLMPRSRNYLVASRTIGVIIISSWLRLDSSRRVESSSTMCSQLLLTSCAEMTRTS